MDFYITKEEVVKSINLTLGVVEKRQTLPILSNVLFVQTFKVGWWETSCVKAMHSNISGYSFNSVNNLHFSLYS